MAFWNRNTFGLTDRVALLEGAWFAPLAPGQRFDLIVSNPPYIAVDEMATLDPDVRDYEPRLALTDDQRLATVGGVGMLCLVVSPAQR